MLDTFVLPGRFGGRPTASPPSGERLARATSPRLMTFLWSRIAATDPGLLRLLLAMRGTLSVGLTASVLAAIAARYGYPITEFAFGVVLSMVGPFIMRDPTRRQRQITLLLLLPPAAVAVTASALLHPYPAAGEIWFLSLVFLGALMQARHPRAIGLGLIAVIMTYVGLYLRLPISTLPLQLASLGVGAACVWTVCFVLLPLRPVATLQRAVRSVQRRAGRVLTEAGNSPDPRTLRRHLVRLNDAALAAEDQLVLLDEPSRLDVRLHLFDLEQAVARLLALVVAGSFTDRHWDRLRMMGARLRWGRAGRLVRPGRTSDPVRQTLGALIHASSALQLAADHAVAASSRAIQTPAPPPGRLAWSGALQVTLASLAAMAGGMALSPQRWFWAVITVYVVFLNTRTRGDALHKGLHRVAGTLVGLFGGLLIAVSIEGNHAAECAIMLIGVFGIYYFYSVSYSLAIFCVTVLLGMIYGMLGTPLEQLLLLRLEETAIGVLAAGLAASFVLPTPIRHQVRLSGLQVLRSLRDVALTSLAALEGGSRLAPIEAMRRLDRQMGDLRLAFAPLSAGRFIMRRARAERPLTALLACADAARAVAAAADSPAAEHDLPALRGQVAMVEAQIEAMLTDGNAPEADHSAEVADSPAGEALRRLDLALAMLSERLAGNVLDGFAVD
jgi:Fusaric acid resistance protein-like